MNKDFKNRFLLNLKSGRFMFGMKWERMIEWTKDVWREKPGIGELYMMTRMAIRAYLSPIPRDEYLKRLLICEHCPVFDKQFKACRNGERGCGCFTPYKALANVECWLREQDPEGKAGWGKIPIK